MNVIGQAARRHLQPYRWLVRLLTGAVLAAVALVPPIARTHDRLDARTPAQQHSRFRWANSCESIPQKLTTVTVVVPVHRPGPAVVHQPPLSRGHGLPIDQVQLLPPAPPDAPRALRAPPTPLA